MNQHQLPLLQVIVPCYNPQPGWHLTLAGRFIELRTSVAAFCDLNLVLVNDGSTEGVRMEDINDLRSKVESLVYLVYDQNRGKGAALRKGIEASHATNLLITDVDFPYTTESMASVVKKLLSEGGIVSGHREENYYNRVPWFRRVLSKTFRLLIKYFMRLPVSDSQCGLKGMDTTGKALFLQTRIDRYLYDLEFLQLANRMVPVHAVRVELREGVTFTTMGFRILKTESGNFLRLLLQRR